MQVQKGQKWPQESVRVKERSIASSLIQVLSDCFVSSPSHPLLDTPVTSHHLQLQLPRRIPLDLWITFDIEARNQLKELSSPVTLQVLIGPSTSSGGMCIWHIWFLSFFLSLVAEFAVYILRTHPTWYVEIQPFEMESNFFVKITGDMEKENWTE